MQFIARGWLAFELTGTNRGLGGVFLAFGIPLLLFTPFGGVLADRVPKRLLTQVGNSLLIVSGFAVGVAVTFDALQYWMLLAASAVQAIGFAAIGPVRTAFTSELVGRELLPNAIVLQQLSMNSTRVFGPAAAGALTGIAAFGAEGVYFLTTGIMVLSTLCTLPLPTGAPPPGATRRSPRAEFVDGLTYVRSRPVLSRHVVVLFLVVMLSFPYVAFLPSIADKFDAGSAGFGFLNGFSSIGAVIASIYIANRARAAGAMRLQIAAGIGFGAGVAAIGAAPVFAVALLVAVVIGGSSSAFQGLNHTLAIDRTDFEYHGRVQALLMLSFSGFGLAAWPLGLLADAIGLEVTLGLMGLSTVAVMLAFASLNRRSIVEETAFA